MTHSAFNLNPLVFVFELATATLYVKGVGGDAEKIAQQLSEKSSEMAAQAQEKVKSIPNVGTAIENVQADIQKKGGILGWLPEVPQHAPMVRGGAVGWWLGSWVVG